MATDKSDQRSTNFPSLTLAAILAVLKELVSLLGRSVALRLLDVGRAERHLAQGRMLSSPAFLTVGKWCVPRTGFLSPLRTVQIPPGKRIWENLVRFRSGEWK